LVSNWHGTEYSHPEFYFFKRQAAPGCIFNDHHWCSAEYGAGSGSYSRTKKSKHPRTGKPVEMPGWARLVISTDGFMVTNHHVIDNAISIKAFCRRFGINCQPGGADPSTDIAILKVYRKT
jgi:S1-C subfamily serine protease